MQANKHVFRGRVRVSKVAAIFRIVSEMARRGDIQYQLGMEDLSRIVKQDNLVWWFNLSRWMCSISEPCFSERAMIDANKMLTLNAFELGSQNVYDAAKISAGILGRYRIPCKCMSYSRAKRIASLSLRRLDGIRTENPLPI
jgi:hypothetical protein